MIIDDSTWRHHFMKHICPLEGHKLIAVPSVVGKLQDNGKVNISSWRPGVVISNSDIENISPRNIIKSQLWKNARLKSGKNVK
jgi:hypothetical protein